MWQVGLVCCEVQLQMWCPACLVTYVAALVTYHRVIRVPAATLMTWMVDCSTDYYNTFQHDRNTAAQKVNVVAEKTILSRTMLIPDDTTLCNGIAIARSALQLARSEIGSVSVVARAAHCGGGSALCHACGR